MRVEKICTSNLKFSLKKKKPMKKITSTTIIRKRKNISIEVNRKKKI